MTLLVTDLDGLPIHRHLGGSPSETRDLVEVDWALRSSPSFRDS